MLDPRLVLLGALLSLVGSSRYAWATVQGHTRPNRLTWFLWAAAPLIGFGAQLDDGVGWPSVLTLSIGLGPAMVFASTFVTRRSYWRLGSFDLGCGAVSVAALVVWLSLPDPEPAVLVAVLADLVAGVPTVRKAWSHPETEHPSVFLFSGANGVLTLFTIDTWSPTTYAFPIYLVVLSTVLSTLVLARLGPRLATRTGRLVSAER